MQLAGADLATARAGDLLGHRTDVADLLAAADLAVVTSDWEARQLFAQEALRAGVPLVATAVGGLPELVGDAAVLVPPGDVDALDAAVRRLLDDPHGARGATPRAARAGRDLADRGRHRAHRSRPSTRELTRGRRRAVKRRCGPPAAPAGVGGRAAVPAGARRRAGRHPRAGAAAGNPTTCG